MTIEPKTNIEALKALINFVIATESELKNADVNFDGKISMTESIQLAMNIALISPNFLRKLRQIPIEAMDLEKNEEEMLAEYVASLTGDDAGNEILLLIILSTIKNLRLFSLIRSKKGKVPANFIAAKAVKMPFIFTKIDENTFAISSTTHDVVENRRETNVQTFECVRTVYFSTVVVPTHKKAYNAEKAREYRARKKAIKIKIAQEAQKTQVV